MDAEEILGVVVLFFFFKPEAFSLKRRGKFRRLGIAIRCHDISRVMLP